MNIKDVNTFEGWKKLDKAHDFRCVYCGLDFLSSPCAFASAVKDHFIPRKEGGEELVSSCSFCNMLKGSSRFKDIPIARKEIKKRQEEYLTRCEFEELKAKYRKGRIDENPKNP
ncbi:MAG: hypothetical protein AUJ76_04405 [Candidatus Omnitrophica bacterium CG1_02_41_171]|nr:MAG: hypothetical protein AUJ76_04405 [Candidatus Omnitrophica bacterium CG1_02_41_171]